MERFWKAMSYLVGVVSIGLVFALATFLTSVEIQDLDLWLHLAMGKFIVTNGYIPAADVLSCAIAGRPWVNHEWLFQVLVYLVFDHSGADGLIFMQTVVVTVTFLILLFLCYRKDKQMAVSFLLLLVLLVYQARFTIRPDIFSLLFFSIYVFVLSWHLEKRWSIYVLLLTQILWSNVHGFFFLGPFIVLLSLLSELTKRRFKLPFEWNTAGRLTDEEYSRLKRILGLVILACLVNPLTFEGAWYPIKVLLQLPGESKIFFENIQELQRPLSWHTLFSIKDFPHYKLLIYLSFMSFVLNFRKIDIGSFVFWLFFLLFSLAAKRNIVFFAFAAYLTCMSNIIHLRLKDVLPISFRTEKFNTMTGVLLKVLLCLWMLDYGTGFKDQGYYDFEKYERKSSFGGISQRNFPSKAADFLVKHRVQGNFFNDFNSGAYILGRCFPNIKVFIDGRTEEYGAQFFKQYQKMWKDGDPKLLDDALERYHLTGALLNSVQSPVPKGILKYFYDKGWAIVYFDYDAVIFLKDVPQNKKIIDEFRIDLTTWKGRPMDLRRLGAVRVSPFQQINRAYTLESMGFDDAAIMESKEALKISPAVAEPYKLLGKIYGKRGEHEKAFENFRLAAMIAPEDTEIRGNLALAYEKLGDFKGAIGQYEKILHYDPKGPRWYFEMSKAYALDKQYENALKNLKHAHQLDPSDVVDLLKVGDIFCDQKEFKMAKEVFQMALSTKKRKSEVHHKLGLCYQAEGESNLAQEEFKKEILLNSTNAN